MHKVFLIGDLHLGHKRILEFSPQRGGITIEEHNEWIIQQWNSVVRKNDMVWVLGDVAFSQDALKLVQRLRGHKKLVRGNHDTQATTAYLEHFKNVYGIVKEYGMWLTHAPIHPDELRGKVNVHGHVHHKSIADPRYLNVSVENINGIPMSLDEARSVFKERGIDV